MTWGIFLVWTHDLFLKLMGKYDFYFDETYRYAVEVRHSSWFSDLAYNFFKDNNICLTWNQLDMIQTPPVERVISYISGL
jgi:hypothetical protein